MAKANLPIWDKRMIQLADHCVKHEVCQSRRHFCRQIGLTPENLPQITSGKQSFRLHHILAAAQLYGINVNWIMGLEQEMFRKDLPVNKLIKALS
jgi:hypothetical protein